MSTNLVQGEEHVQLKRKLGLSAAIALERFHQQQDVPYLLF